MSDLLRSPPADVRAAIRAVSEGVASDGQQRRFYRFVVHELCRIGTVALSTPEESSVQNWRAGLRYVGLFLEAARQIPADDPPPPEPRPRTMTESARRRNLSTAKR